MQISPDILRVLAASVIPWPPCGYELYCTALSPWPGRFPVPPAAMAILGGGYAVSLLESFDWLATLDLVYWGDIDTHGFAILDRLRGSHAHVNSMLMDRTTLLAQRGQRGTEPVPATSPLDHLDQAESALHADLISNAYGPSVRLEQEKIRFSAIQPAITRQSGS